MNIYWNDLSQEGKSNLLDNGFEPTKEQLAEQEPLGKMTLKQ